MDVQLDELVSIGADNSLLEGVARGAAKIITVDTSRMKVENAVSSALSGKKLVDLKRIDFLRNDFFNLLFPIYITHLTPEEKEKAIQRATEVINASDFKEK